MIEWNLAVISSSLSNHFTVHVRWQKALLFLKDSCVRSTFYLFTLSGSTREPQMDSGSQWISETKTVELNAFVYPLWRFTFCVQILPWPSMVDWICYLAGLGISYVPRMMAQISPTHHVWCPGYLLRTTRDGPDISYVPRVMTQISTYHVWWPGYFLRTTCNGPGMAKLRWWLPLDLNNGMACSWN